MCGIIAGITQRNITPILIEGLLRLEYRGYDSAGIAIINQDKVLERIRAAGKVAKLAEKIKQNPLIGYLGIAHTRWATHGIPNEENAHPHVSTEKVAIVHNGIIENHATLRKNLQEKGFIFQSDTDTEVIAHLLADLRQQGISHFEAIQQLPEILQGSFALAIIFADKSDTLFACRQGSPLLLGIGIEEHFIASDIQALVRVTNDFIVLEEGDCLAIQLTNFTIVNQGKIVNREIKNIALSGNQVSKDGYKHFMLKEIFEQPYALQANCAGRLENGQLQLDWNKPFTEHVDNIHIIACGSSYHAGLTAKYWFEEIAGISCQVEVASEYRYRSVAIPKNTLFLCISQSGETADTLEALRLAKQKDYQASLAICNVAESSMVRESDYVLLTRAGPEIGVASTKAFTSQLLVLFLIVLDFAKKQNKEINAYLNEIKQVHTVAETILKLEKTIKKWAQDFEDYEHALFLGRGIHYPIAIESALKLKEISYIHAEAYPAGELKHGPLALIDHNMPVIVLAPKNDLKEKLKSNIEEICVRGGKVYIFAEEDLGLNHEQIKTLLLPITLPNLSPLLHTLALQLLSYHVADMRGNDIDQPRNLAKAVTVE